MSDKKVYFISPPIDGEFVYLEFAPIVNAGYIMPKFTEYADLIRDIEDFFVKGSDDDAFLKIQELEFYAQEYINSENILTADLLSCLPEMFDESFDFPVFSKRFVERMGAQLQEDIEFYPCTVICESVKYDFFIGRIIKYLPFTDENSKSQEGLTIDRHVVNDNSFYIAKDQGIRHGVVVSKEFKDLVEANDLNMYFYEI